MDSRSNYLRQKWRFVAFFLNTALFYALYVWASGTWNPADGNKAIWLFAAVAWWTISLLSAPFFRPPRDALSAACGALGVLVTLDTDTAIAFVSQLSVLRWIGIGYAVLVASVAILAAFLQYAGRHEMARRAAFSLADRLARGEVLLGIPAFISILGFYSDPTVVLVLGGAWVIFASLSPVELAVILVLRALAVAGKRSQDFPVGLVRRVDHPNIVRVALSDVTPWSNDNLYVACLPGGRASYVIPLFSHVQDDELVGTGFCIGDASDEMVSPSTGEVYECATPELMPSLVRELIGGNEEAELVGFVVEGSSISTVKFEVARDRGLEEGMVVFCNLPSGRVYYQILDAETAEESFRQNPRGTHIVKAAQLGTLDDDHGFRKFPWLPPMNNPVFKMSGSLRSDTKVHAGEFIVGKIPSTNIGLKVNLPELVEYHSAILGVTGTGKTELALDLIREAVQQNIKVFCVDLTGEYRKRLTDLAPKAMGLPLAESVELDKRLFEVETGEYKAAAEKKALKVFVDDVRSRVAKHVEEFLEHEQDWLGLFELVEVTNTRATLRTTELFLSEIMLWARKNRRKRRVLIVLEEAHTIIPETMGSGFDHDTQWVVGRIGQIALQGRKYGVGLMLISQRTALVSKTILSQCNTYFTYSLVDQTSLGYLANIYDGDHVRVIPNLRFLEFVAFGKAVRSERPMLVRRDFDQQKLQASRELNHPAGQEPREATSEPEPPNLELVHGSTVKWP